MTTAADNDAFEAAMADAARATRDEVQNRLIIQIETLEGRRPSSDEISLFLVRGCWQSGREEWRWRGQTILILEPPTLESPSWRISY